MSKDVWNLMIAFTRASNLGFGGGPAVIPLIQKEVVGRYQWMTEEEFADALAVGNSLPGPIATKMASYIGYRVAGWVGVLATLTGTVLPTLLITIFLGDLLIRYSDTPALSAALTAVKPVVVILIAQSAYDLGKKAFPQNSQVAWIIAIVALLLMFLTPIHPGFLIIIAMVIGYFTWGREKKLNSIKK
ncbi:chromate transporter [Desulfitobacterium metallireducens]|uniref:Chromate transporter n=1 Tax=Desulfitobacterium metallireducens DSM 15288 TaxID=871968 RepID=W0EBE5_9FIRM|nr:chromate transporter [Desulfitobacterium metallireducens]AHF06853.1 chromate transporter [Desulfitobacterium metallireducens DSM 15288]